MKLPNHAGIVAYRKVRSTGTRVGLYHAEEAGIEADNRAMSTVVEYQNLIKFQDV